VNEIHLVKKAIKGNPKAYGQLIHMYQNYLYKTAYLYLKNEDVALDVVQDSILKGYEAIRKLNHPEYFKTWLTRILINSAITTLKKNNQFNSIDSIEELAEVDKTMLEEKWDLYEAIDKLPEKLKTVIILKYFNDLKISEISHSMNIPEGSVKSYLNRAKQELRLQLKEDYLNVL
jgi:RNA polymerase sigma-70 factor (ECF subfamily)